MDDSDAEPAGWCTGCGSRNSAWQAVFICHVQGYGRQSGHGSCRHIKFLSAFCDRLALHRGAGRLYDVRQGKEDGYGGCTEIK